MEAGILAAAFRSLMRRQNGEGRKSPIGFALDGSSGVVANLFLRDTARQFGK